MPQLTLLLRERCSIVVEEAALLGEVAPLLAEAIHQVFHDGSVTSLFDGNA